jgi:hypothetical protein
MQAKPLHFFIEQVALCPPDPVRAIDLLTKMGLGEWARDHVVAVGRVYGCGGTNEADLAFNYQAQNDDKTLGPESRAYVPSSHIVAKPLELEVLHYTKGPNWMESHEPSVSHIGMHCDMEELNRWRAFFQEQGIDEVQSVRTLSHTNPVIAGKRSYNYVIFGTRAVLGVDVKFIVRIE